MEHKSFIETVFDIDDQYFFDKYWEKNFYKSNEALNPSRFDSFFNIKNLETLLHEGFLTTQHVRLASAKGNPQPSSYSSENGRILNDKLFYFFNLGNTIVLRNSEFYFPLVNKIGESFKLGSPLFKKFFVNLYLTPANSQGFVTHFDTQEVFIVQVLGSKKWSLYNPSNGLPLEDISIPIKNSNIVNGAALLKKGSALYIPRGVYHEAQTSENISCHLTFSYVPITNYDILKTALEIKAIENLELRKSFFNSNVLDEYQTATQKELDLAVISFKSIQKIKSPSFQDHLSHIGSLNRESKVQRTIFEYTVKKDEEASYCLINTMQYRFPLDSFELITYFERNREPIEISLVPTTYDAEGTFLIIEKLIRIGYIETVNV